MPAPSIKSQSVWIDASESPRASPRAYSQETDVVVVGAGITGLTAALKLKQAGHSVTVLDAGHPGRGTTGHSSAHVSAIPDAGYAAIAIKHGRDAAQAVAEGLRAAVAEIASAGDRCGWVPAPVYLSAAEADHTGQLEREREALASVGFDVSDIDSAPLPGGTLAGLRIEGQGLFQPMDYIALLLEKLDRLNVPVVSKELVQDVEETPDGAVVTTRDNRILARHVALATHSPWTLLAEAQIVPYRSYLVAMELREPLPQALFWDTARPYHYIRPIEIDGQAMALVGGSDHRVGYFRDDDWRAYATLESYARNRLGATRARYRWSAQLYDPVDGLPFIGRAAGKRCIWMATGFSGNGLAFGALAGRLIAEAIDTGESPPPLAHFSPDRIADVSSIPRLVAENVRSGFRMARDRVLRKGLAEMEALAPGEGDVFEVNGELVAACRTRKGKLIKRSAVCVHMSGIVSWNPLEQSWDCPIHGGRYSRSGKRLEGPPCRGLRQLKRQPSPSDSQQ